MTAMNAEAVEHRLYDAEATLDRLGSLLKITRAALHDKIEQMQCRAKVEEINFVESILDVIDIAAGQIRQAKEELDPVETFIRKAVIAEDRAATEPRGDQ